MTDRELMQQAFDAMSYGNTDEREAVRVALRDRLAQPEEASVPLKDAIKMVTAAVDENQRLKAELKFNTLERLAQPEEEPVAYYNPHKGFYWAKPTGISAPTAVDVKPLPLYIAPAQRKPLTDVELADLWYKQSLDWLEFGRAIEAAHGIKGEA
jgi:hypothetical protein